MCNRSRSNAISGTRDYLELNLTSVELDMLESERKKGIARGVLVLSKMSCDIESVIWSGVSSGASLASSNLSYGFKSSESQNSPTFDRLGTGVADASADGVSGMLQWAWGKVEEKIENNEWIQRVVKVFGIGLKFLLSYCKSALLNADLVKSLVPLYGPIKGLIDTGIKIYNAVTAKNALNRISEFAVNIGSGIPTVMFENLKSYLNREIAVNAGQATWNFGKSLANVLVSIFAAPAASAMNLVLSIIEAVSSFVYLIFQGLTFQKATDKCREWVKEGDISKDLSFSDGVTACPFIGCVFFGMANYIGHFNLTALLSKGSAVLSSPSLTLAISGVSEIQRTACTYVADTNVPFKMIDSNDEWMLKMMKGFANTAPRSEFVTDDASFSQKFVHYFKIGSRKAGKAATTAYGFLG